MTAPSKTFSAPTDAQIDVDSPLDATLMTQIRDALIHLEEWIGKDYTAATNHNHDGQNSASLDIGSDTIRNGSFETNTLAGWTETAYTGGSLATGTAGAMDGEYCAAITSTVAANGGGDLVSSESAVTGGQVKQFRLSFAATAIEVASSAVVQWLDASSAQISESTIYTTTSTPTSARLCVRRISAPANARFCKVKLIGGKTDAGAVNTGTGTVYFDGVVVESPAMLGGSQVFTASGTFSAVWGDVEIELCGGGGAGGNDSTGGTTGWGNAGSTTTFSTISATGGEGYGRADVGGYDGTGGVGTGGSVLKNGYTGLEMPYPYQALGVNEGGKSYMRGAGSATREAGDGGYGLLGGSGVGTGGGGGAGGYAYGLITTSGDVTVTVGAGGLPGSGAQGQAGMDGVVKVNW